nr:immunoglobulin heavy chain junction region [Macaca mulatta]MOY18678.1 immunoglobulin heavy chain junction region [Macaca mulatta]MOY18986.1 immunoglobulin heavy chain junction region [Macaca mulatta]MOY19035.1 immunoglobulin heavy chain junction region [Macaca mulatta]MOY19086.1 immunoglobulin heavy chain junction region [Macaca mulatta]
CVRDGYGRGLDSW